MALSAGVMQYHRAPTLYFLSGHQNFQNLGH